MPRFGPSGAREVAVLVACALLFPASAGAATVKAQEDQCAVGPPNCVTDLEVEAESTERNDISVYADGAGVVVTDAATPLVAGRNCVRRLDGSVRCELSRPIAQVQVQTGDRDSAVRVALPHTDLVSAILGLGHDRFEGEAKEVWANGLDGDDTLIAVGGRASFEGREGADTLIGGPQSDKELSGGPGRDRVSGGAGDDVLLGEDTGIDDRDVPARDELDGGEGRDLVSYSRRELVVAIDLAAGSAGTAREGDVLRAIENARGGRGHDRLAGDEGPNRLLGDDGADTLSGRGGDDFLSLDNAWRGRIERASGGAGDDELRGRYGGLLIGGPGDDLLRGGGLTSTLCGAGADVVRPRPGATMRMGGDCECWALRVTTSRAEVAPAVLARPRIDGDTIRLPVRCPYADAGCILRLRVTTPGLRPIGIARAQTAAGQRKVLAVHAPALRRARAVRVEFSIRRLGYGGGGGAVVVGR
jgi:hypothetical protein